MRVGFAAAALLALCATPAHSDYKQFKDWFAACDNLRNCHTYGTPATASARVMPCVPRWKRCRATASSKVVCWSSMAMFR